MKSLKNKKGITLVALVITIVVLLILAVILINSINNNGIIGKAKEARNNYTNSAEKEQSSLDYYTAVLNDNLGKWTQEGDTLTCTTTNGKVTLKIGDYVDYNAGNEYSYTSYSLANASSNKNNGRTSGSETDQTFNSGKMLRNDNNEPVTENGWRVLGLEDGKIQLISANPIYSTADAEYSLKGIEGYKNAEKELDEICSIFGHGTGAESARSLKAEDVTKLSGEYDSSQDMAVSYGMACYGENVQFTGDYSNNRIKWKLETSMNEWSTFPEGLTQINVPGLEVDTTTTDVKTLRVDAWGMYSIQDTAKVIKCGSDGLTFANTWLSSRCVTADAGNCYFNVRGVGGGYVDGGGLCISSNGPYSGSWAVRPVVSLKSNIQITQKAGTSANPHTIQ